MTEAQRWLLKVGLDDKCVGTMSRTEGGMVIVDGGLIYVSDLMMAWAKRSHTRRTSMMNDLQKRFEETGKSYFITREEDGDLILYFNPEYVRWLESGNKELLEALKEIRNWSLITGTGFNREGIAGIAGIAEKAIAEAIQGEQG